ncbi:RNA-directed DNA polymerase, eukaryota, reverse transcriptase zinc-binding domain protein [Tanacetum coccineum]
MFGLRGIDLMLLISRRNNLRSYFYDIYDRQGIANETDLFYRRDSIHILEDLDKREISDIAKKARVKWAMEGDENSQFFHATVKKNLRQLAIKGIQNNGDWIVDPDCIKDEFRFVQDFFCTPVILKGCNSSFIALIPKVSNATLVTDFRPISLIGCQYKIIGKILANRLSKVIGSCISLEHLAFIKGRNILDGPLVLNEVMAWHRSRKKQLMIFKVYFEKAFDSLKWDFLDLVMEKLGFGIKWRSWIKGCLHNARAFVLVNGSPTNEFEIFRGLKQGDPLSPFLFILAMEGLHAFICKAINMGMYKGSFKMLLIFGLILSRPSMGSMVVFLKVQRIVQALARGVVFFLPLDLSILKVSIFLLYVFRGLEMEFLSGFGRMFRGGIEATQFADLKCRIGDVTLSDHNDA